MNSTLISPTVFSLISPSSSSPPPANPQFSPSFTKHAKISFCTRALLSKSPIGAKSAGPIPAAELLDVVQLAAKTGAEVVMDAVNKPRNISYKGVTDLVTEYMGKPKEGGISANWESSHTLLFCDLCIREIELGNRPTTHFSKDGWKNLVMKFKDGTGLLYDRAQLKNKWDQLKREWKLWKDLKKGETGLGWDPIKKTIDASDLWWQERIKMIPLAKNFRYAGIAPELEERLDSMFRQVVATGRNVWFPAAGIMPPLFADEEVVLVDEDNSTELGDDIASPPEKVPLPKKLGKRKKVEKGRKNDILARMDDLVESSRSVSSRITTPIVPPSLLLLDEAVDEIEKNEEICADPEFYDFATVFLLTTVNKGMFLKLPAHKRVIWLKNRYNQSTGRVG